MLFGRPSEESRDTWRVTRDTWHVLAVWWSVTTGWSTAPWSPESSSPSLVTVDTEPVLTICCWWPQHHTTTNTEIIIAKHGRGPLSRSPILCQLTLTWINLCCRQVVCAQHYSVGCSFASNPRFQALYPVHSVSSSTPAYSLPSFPGCDVDNMKQLPQLAE